jgi:hypothetical protein
MCLTSLHHLVISDAALESPSRFRMTVPFTIKSIVIVDVGPRRQDVSRDWHVEIILKMKAICRYSALTRVSIYYNEPATAMKQASYLILFDRARARGL